MKYQNRLLYHFLGATAAIGKCIAKEEDQSSLPLGLSGLNYLLSTNWEERGSSMNQNRNLRSKPDRVLKGTTQKTSSSTSSRFDSTPNYTRMRKNDQIETDPIGCFEDQSSVDYIEFQDSLDIIEDCGEHCSTDFFGLVGATCKCFLETPVKRISISSCRDVGMDVYFKSTWSDQCNQDITRNLRNQLVQENNADLGYDIVRNTYLPSPFEFYNDGCGTNIYELNTAYSGSEISMTTVSNVLSEYAMERRSHISQSISTSAETSYNSGFASASMKVSASSDYEMNNAFQSSGASEIGSKRFSSFSVHKLSTIKIENFDYRNHFTTFNDEFIDALRDYITSGYSKDYAKKIFDSFGMVVLEYGVVGGFVQISATSKSSDLSDYFSSDTEMKRCYEKAVSMSGKYGSVSGSYSVEEGECSGEALSFMKAAQEQFSSEASETNYVGGSIVPVTGTERDVFSVTPDTAKLLTNADMYDDGDGMRLRLITDFLHPEKIYPPEIKRHQLREEQFEEAQKHLQDHALEILEDIGDILDDCSSCAGVPYLEFLSGTDDFMCDCYDPTLTTKAGYISIYEAEDSSNILSQTLVETTNVGFTGSGYADMGGKGSWIEWPAVDGGNGKTCTLKFRYALSNLYGYSPRPCQILVNDVDVGTVAFPAVGSWYDYGSDSIDIMCPEGLFKVRMRATTSYGGPNVDYLQVIRTYEAEDSILSQTLVKTSPVGFTGSGFADMGGKGSWIEWPAVDGGNGKTCTLKFRYALSNLSPYTLRPCQILVNDVDVGTVAFPAVGSWSDYGSKSIDIMCPEGLFKVRMRATTSYGGPNVDYLAVVWSV